MESNLKTVYIGNNNKISWFIFKWNVHWPTDQYRKIIMKCRYDSNWNLRWITLWCNFVLCCWKSVFRGLRFILGENCKTWEVLILKIFLIIKWLNLILIFHHEMQVRHLIPTTACLQYQHCNNFNDIVDAQLPREYENYPIWKCCSFCINFKAFVNLEESLMSKIQSNGWGCSLLPDFVWQDKGCLIRCIKSTEIYLECFFPQKYQTV